MERVAPVLAIDAHREAVAFCVAGSELEVLLEPRREPGFPGFAAVLQRETVRRRSEHAPGPDAGRGLGPVATDPPAEGVPR